MSIPPTRRKKKDWGSDPLFAINLSRDNVKQQENDLKQAMNKMAEHLPKTNKASLLDLYMADILKEVGHPDKFLITIVEKNIAMMAIIETELSKLMNITTDEEGKPNGPFDPVLAELYRKYSVEVRTGLKDLSKIWDEVADKDVDEFLIEAYKNITAFIEFLKLEDSALIPKFMTWRATYGKEGSKALGPATYFVEENQEAEEN